MSKRHAPTMFTVRSLNSQAAKPTLTKRLRDMARSASKLDRRFQPETVHALRVASRKLRAAWSVFDPEGDRNPATKGLHRALGALRDVQLQLEALTTWRKRATPDEHTTFERFTRSLEEKRERREEEVPPLLEHWQAQVLPSLVEAAAGLKPSGRLGGKRQRRRLEKQVRRLLKRAHRASDKLTPKVAHRLRIEARQTRDQLDVLAVVFPEVQAALGGPLRQLQKLLGELHDLDVLREDLRLFSEAEAPGSHPAEDLLHRMRRHRKKLARRASVALRGVESAAGPLVR